MKIIDDFQKTVDYIVEGFAETFNFNRGPIIPKSKTLEEKHEEMAVQKAEIAAKNMMKHERFAKFKAVKQAKQRVL